MSEEWPPGPLALTTETRAEIRTDAPTALSESTDAPAAGDSQPMNGNDVSEEVKAEPVEAPPETPGESWQQVAVGLARKYALSVVIGLAAVCLASGIGAGKKKRETEEDD